MGVACTGFFQTPAMTTLLVSPPATIHTGSTVQMWAMGMYNDGSQKDLSKQVSWKSETPAVATINSTGLVTGLGTGKSAITASMNGISGRATITVTIGDLTAIQVTPQDGLTAIAYGSGEQFVATGTANGMSVDITNSVTWSTDPASIPNVSIDSHTGRLITTLGPTTTVLFDVIATDVPSGISNRLGFTVHP